GGTFVNGILTVNFKAGSSTAQVIFTAKNDGFGAEADETFTLTVQAGTGDVGGSVQLTIPANGLVVTSTSDSGPGSLRQAVLNANAFAGASTITFAAPLAGQTILLNSELLLTDSATTTIEGGAGVKVSGQGKTRVFHVAGGASAVLDRL